MWHVLTLAALVLTNGSAVQDPSSELMLQIGLHTLRPDGRQQAFAGTHGADSFDRYIWGNEALCWLSTSGSEPLTVPAIGWQMRGRIVKRTGDDFLVDIGWQRLWERSARLSDGPKGSMQVTLKAGDRLLLDEVVPSDTNTCQVASGRLEAAIVAVPLLRQSVGAGGGGGSATAGGFGGGGRGGGGAGRGGRSADTAGGAAGTGAGSAGSGTGVASTGSGRGSVAAGPASTGAGGRGADARESTAEVWLVHKLPTGDEAVQRISFTFGARTGEFEFPPVEIAKDGEKARVTVKGRLRLMGPPGQEKLMVSLDRTIQKDREFGGGSIKMLDLPAPDDVLSFELPLLSTESSLRTVMAGHQFSVRVRVK